MREGRIRAGARVVITTEHGEEEEEVLRVLGGSEEAGVWLVETARQGRVVVLPGEPGRWMRE